MTIRATGLLVLLSIALVVIVAGTWWDLRWHSAHGEATAADLVAAHGLLWVGIGVAIGVAALGRHTVSSRSYQGYRLLLGVALAYAIAEAGHLVVHSLATESQVLHVALALGKVALVAGAASAAQVTRRSMQQRSRAPSRSRDGSARVDGGRR